MAERIKHRQHRFGRDRKHLAARGEEFDHDRGPRRGAADDRPTTLLDEQAAARSTAQTARDAINRASSLSLLSQTANRGGGP
jgi:hypothetical protein